MNFIANPVFMCYSIYGGCALSDGVQIGRCCLCSYYFAINSRTFSIASSSSLHPRRISKIFLSSDSLASFSITSHAFGIFISFSLPTPYIFFKTSKLLPVGLETVVLVCKYFYNPPPLSSPSLLPYSFLFPACAARAFIHKGQKIKCDVRKRKNFITSKFFLALDFLTLMDILAKALPEQETIRKKQGRRCKEGGGL